MPESEPDMPQSPRTPLRSLPSLPLDDLDESPSRSSAPSPEAVDADELQQLVSQHFHLTRHIPYETDLRRLAALRCTLRVIRYNIAKLIGADGMDDDERVDQLAERIAYEYTEGYAPEGSEKSEESEESDEEEIDTENFWRYPYSTARDDSSQEREEVAVDENAMGLEVGQWDLEIELDRTEDDEEEVRVSGEMGLMVQRVRGGGAGRERVETQQ